MRCNPAPVPFSLYFCISLGINLLSVPVFGEFVGFCTNTKKLGEVEAGASPHKALCRTGEVGGGKLCRMRRFQSGAQADVSLLLKSQRKPQAPNSAHSPMKINLHPMLHGWEALPAVKCW